MGMKIDFTGKTVLVVGAGRGLGKAVALAFADCGADVYLGNRDEDQGMQTVEDIKSTGRKAGFTKCDVASKSDFDKLVADAVTFGNGKLDVLVNAAGIVCTQDLMNASTEDIRKLFDVNVIGTSNAIVSGLEVMMKQKSGNIITMTSIAGRTNMGLLQHYCASKAAVISLTQAGAKKGAPFGVRVNSIAPGIIRTAMWEEILDGMASGWNGRSGAAKQTVEEREANWNNSVKAFIPLGHAQQPEDIAWGTLFFASDYAREITGQVLNIDGGTVMM